MESEVNDEIPHIPSPELILTPHLNEDVLRHMATFLDFQSIINFRLVSREWNAACLPVLMKRGTYNLTQPCHDKDERLDLMEGAIKYSSWKISHSVYVSAHLLHDNGMWENVLSLTIHQQIPLSREFHRWAWEPIENRCPNLQELTFMFESVENSAEVDSEVESDYGLAIQGLPNASFPKIPNLTSLASVNFKGIHDKTTAYFAETLLQATTPSSLRHLFFCPIRQPNNVKKEIGAFRIFEYLEQTPRLTKNLQSFGFSLGHYSTDPEEVEVRFGSEPCGFIKFVNRNESTLLPLQFSKNLTTLFWDSPYHRDGHEFLPGVLTPNIASSLVQLHLNNRVENLEETSGPYPKKISFPNFPVLRSLKLGCQAAESLCVPDLIHSAPILSSLEVKADLTGRRPCWKQIQYFILVWRGIIKQSVSYPEHSQLCTFSTDIPFKTLSDLQMILSKFPNLEELRICTVENAGNLDSFINSIQSTHPQLQRLSWTFNAELPVDELCQHLVRVPEVLPSLTSYSLERNDSLCYYSMDNVKETTDILVNLPSSSNTDSNHSCPLIILLLMERLFCECNLEKESDLDFCMKCYLQTFIKTHSLRIRILFPGEIKNIGRKYNWDHRFTSSST
jgi:hypothetical protein